MNTRETEKTPLFTLHREGLVCLFLVIVTLAVYWQAGNHAFVNYDDNKYVTENKHVQAGLTPDSITWAFTATYAGNWHPLTWLSHMLDCQIYGLNPKGHHLTNVVFHILNAILLFLIFRRMTGALWKSAFVAALFALHPLHVESIAWVAERKDVLSTFFWMLTMGSYVWYVERPGTSRYLLVLLFFILGLMAKPMLVTLPFVLLLLDYWPLGRFQFRQPESTISNSTKKSGNLHLFWEKIPLLVFAVTSSVVTFFAQQSGGAVRSLEVFPLSIRIENALVSYVSYIGKMIFPHNLAVLYPHPNDFTMWQVTGAGLLLILISCMAIRMIRRSPYFMVGWLWYLGTLVPVIGLVQVGEQSMADRYTYVPLIGLFVMITWSVSNLAAGWRYRKEGFAVVSAILLSILIVTTWFQVKHWTNSIILFKHAINVTENNSVAHYNLGVALAKQGRTTEAIDHYTEVLKINPDYVGAHNNLGVALVEQGKIDEAIAHYRETLRIKPDDVEARYNIANALARQERFKDAIAEYAEVLKTKPNMAFAHNNMGIALSRLGKTKKAIFHFREALRIRPDYRNAEYNLQVALRKEETVESAVVRRPYVKQVNINDAEAQMRLGLELLQKRDFGGAIKHFRKVLKINPELIEAHINIGLALAYNQEIDEAVDHFQKALKINPELAEVHNSLGVALVQKGKLDKAVSHFKEALRIKPDFAKAHNSLGVVMARMGRTKDAIFHFREALRIKPGYEDADKNLKIVLGIQSKSQ